MSPERTAEFAEARELQWTWKTAAMETMAVAVCRLAIVRGTSGEFSANDLNLDHGGQGIAGSIFTRLAADEVIAPVGWWGEATDDPARGHARPIFQQKYVRNAGGNRIGVWRLKSHARASALLRAHEARVSVQQTLQQAELTGL